MPDDTPTPNTNSNPQPISPQAPAPGDVEPSTAVGESPFPQQQSTSPAQAAQIYAPAQQSNVQPTVLGSGPQPGYAQPQAPKKKRKGLIAGIIIAAVLVLLGAGGALAYNFWYQNPDKIIVDAVQNAIKAKSVSMTGEIKATASNGVVIGITMDGKNDASKGEFNSKLSVTYDDQTFNLDAAVRVPGDGSYFIKADGVEDIIDTLSDVSASPAPAQIVSFAQKIDGNWIKIEKSDIDELTGDTNKTQECVTDVMKKLQDDTSYSNEIAKIYKEHKFIDAGTPLATETIDGVASFKFEIKGDEEKAEAFGKAFEGTKLYSELKGCNEDIAEAAKESVDDSSAASTSEPDATLYVWVSRWTHEFTKIEIVSKEDSDSDIKASVETKFNQDVAVESPADFITFKQLQKDVEELMGDYMAPSSQLYSTQEYDYTTDL